jgi:hypothetical protein
MNETTYIPSSVPSLSPTPSPVLAPSADVSSDSGSPTYSPTLSPTTTTSPSQNPTRSPSISIITTVPSRQPTKSPTVIPTQSPHSSAPSFQPSRRPSFHPTVQPTLAPTTLNITHDVEILYDRFHDPIVYGLIGLELIVMFGFILGYFCSKWRRPRTEEDQSLLVRRTNNNENDIELNAYDEWDRMTVTRTVNSDDGQGPRPVWMESARTVVQTEDLKPISYAEFGGKTMASTSPVMQDHPFKPSYRHIFPVKPTKE